MKKKFLSIILSAIMLVACFNSGIVALAAGTSSGTCGDNVQWSFANNTLTITGSGAMWDFDSSNRPTYESNRTEIKNVIFGDNITHIGNYSFFGSYSTTYNQLKGTLVLPANLESIGTYAFYGTYMTGDLIIPDSVTSISDFAFFNGSGFKGSLTLETQESSLQTIGVNAFANCGFTGPLTIPDSVVTIGNNAFSGCGGFNGGLTIGSSVQTIGNSAFQNCRRITGKLSIPESVSSIGSCAFHGVSSSVSIPTFFEDYPEYYTVVDAGITEPTPSSSGYHQYKYNCTDPSHTSAYYANMGSYSERIPYVAITSLSASNEPFNVEIDTTVQTPVTVTPEDATMSALQYSSSDTSVAKVSNQGVITALTDGDADITVTSKYNSNLSAVVHVHVYTPHFSIETIDPETNLMAVKPGETKQINVTLTPERASAQDLVFESADTSVASVSASGVVTGVSSGETSITVSSIEDSDISTVVTVRVLNYIAEGQCGDDVYWYIADNNGNGTLYLYGSGAMWDFDGNNRPTYEEYINDFSRLVIEYGVSVIGRYAFYKLFGNNPPSNAMPYSNLKGDLIIPDSVTEIKSGAFQKSGFDGILDLGDSLTTLGGSVFSECKNFTGDLIIPNTVTLTGEAIFADCSGFDGNLVLSNSLQSIRAQSFRQCNNLTGSLVIPDSVTYIDTSAFAGLNNMTGTLTLSNNLTAIMHTAFSTCGFTGELRIPNSVTRIGNRAFINCDGFSSLVLGSSLQKIELGAFLGCKNLTGKLTIPESVSEIGNCAFHGCAADTDIEMFFEDYPEYIELVEISRTEPTQYSNGVVQYQVNCTCLYHKNSYCEYPKLIKTIEHVIPYVYVDTITPEEVPQAIVAGEAYQLNIVISPTDATIPSMNYSSSNENVATVDNTGLVTGVGEGRAVITAAATDGSDRSASFTVAIEDPANLFRGQCGNNVYWYIDPDGELHIYGNGDMWDYSATYRPTYETHVDSFSHLVVEEGVTSIGEYAFYREALTGDQPIQELQYLNLTGYLILPESIQDVGKDAFRNCKNLDSEYVTIDEDPVEQSGNTEISDVDAISGIIQRLIALIIKIVAMIKSLVGQNQ